MTLPRQELVARLDDSFRQWGFAIVTDHGIDATLVDHGWRLTGQFFALPEAEKLRWHDPEGAGQRGYTPFGREVAKHSAIHDLKEFWHVGRDPAEAGAPPLPDNVWPDRPAGFRDTFSALYRQFDEAAMRLLSLIAPSLDLPGDWFEGAARGGNSILRLLHYPPLPAETSGAVRAGAHGDINLITLLLGAEEAGLEILSRSGEWLPIDPPEGALVVNIGDMMERLTNHRLPSTTHRVRNPDTARAGHSRYSMPFFLHPRPEFRIATLASCIDSGHPDRYPDAITADDFLRQRLVEIGLV